MAGLNRIMLIGNLGADPELRQTQNGMEVANFSLATKESYTKNGQKVEQTEWHRIVVWGKTAANCKQFLHKGSRAFIEGKLQTRKYQKNGVDHYATEVVALNIQFLDSKPKTDQPHDFPPAGEPTTAPTEEFDYSNIPF